MGQQQLLLVVLGVIIVGTAIIAGIDLFQGNFVESHRNELTNECLHLASLAQTYYLKPTVLGGGGRSYENWQIPLDIVSTGNATYTADVKADNVTITAVGKELVEEGLYVTVRVTINPPPQNFVVDIIHWKTFGTILANTNGK